MFSRSVALTLLLAFAIGCNVPSDARGNHGRQSGHRPSAVNESTTRQEEPEQSAEEEAAPTQQEEIVPRERRRASREESAGVGALGSGLKSSLEDRFRQQAGPEGISLFNVVENLLEMAFLIILLVSVPICGSVTFCAMIWHSQKILNGGKKPSIG